MYFYPVILQLIINFLGLGIMFNKNQDFIFLNLIVTYILTLIKVKIFGLSSRYILLTCFKPDHCISYLNNERN